MEMRYFPAGVLAFLLATSISSLLADEPALAPSPRAPGLAAQLALAEERGDWLAAAEIARRQLAETPDDLDLLTGLARYQRSSGDLDRAAATLQSVVTLAGEASADVLEIRGDIATSEVRVTDALSDYQIALRAAPGSVRLLEKLALHYTQAGEPDTAAIYFRRLAALREERGDHLQLARAAVRLRDWNQMLQHLAIASEIPDPRKRRSGSSYQFESLLSKAMQLSRYDRAIKADPKDLAAILSRAELFHACGFYDEALEEAKRAARIDGRAPHVRLHLAHYYAAAGDRKKGAEFNVNMQELNPSKQSSRFYFDLRLADREVREKPGDISPLRVRAKLLIVNKQAPLAMEDIDRALAIDPDSVNTLLLKIEALKLIGETIEARELVRRLAGDHPENEDIQQQIGQIQMEDGLYEAAIVTFDSILGRRPRYEAARNSRTLCYKRLQTQPPAPADQSSATPAS